MPSKNFRQARLMAGAAHDPVFARKVGVSPRVAKEYNKADDRSGFLSSAMRTKMAEGGKVEKPKEEPPEPPRQRDPNSAKDAYEQQWDKFRTPKKLFRSDTDIPNNRPQTKAKGGTVNTGALASSGPDRNIEVSEKEGKKFLKDALGYNTGGKVRGTGKALRGFRPAKIY